MEIDERWAEAAIDAAFGALRVGPPENVISEAVLEKVAPLIWSAAIEAAAARLDHDAKMMDGMMRLTTLGARDRIRALAEPLPQEQDGPDDARADEAAR